MSRKTIKIKVEDMDSKKYDVELKTRLSWGEKENIQEELTKGAGFNMKAGKTSKPEDMDISYDPTVLRKSKYVAMETVISSIKDEDNKEINFSKDWADNLTSESGDELYNKIDEINNTQKKN